MSAVSFDLAIPAHDGYLLGARLWQGSSKRAVALINGGAGIRLDYYDPFAAFLAETGIPTVVYDYRGIGRSRKGHLRGFKASVEDWGSKDCAAVIQWLADNFPDRERLLVGHSVGGFLAGFAPNGSLINQLLLIGAHTGYWRDYAARARPSMFALWHLLMPIVTSFVGFFPARALHLGEDLPAGVAKEWADRRKGDFWWNLRRPDGTMDNERRDALLARFGSVRARALALRFADDPFATEAATRRLLALYANASATTVELHPSDAGRARIGHFGFFRPRMRETLWPHLVGWLHDIRPLALDTTRAAD